MRKIVAIADGLMKKSDLLDPRIAERFKKFERFGATYIVAEDTTCARMGGRPSEFILKVETEGPEWVEPDQDVIEKIKDAEIILTHFSGISGKMLAMAKGLKLIGVMRSGIENVNAQKAKELGIKVMNCPGRAGEPVADFTVALILNEARNISRDNLKARNGEWLLFDSKDTANAALKNHIVGLVGLGMIGKKVATRLKAFGMTVLAYDPFCKPEEALAAGVSLVDFPELLKSSDFVSVHARLSPETQNLIGENEFRMMKPTAIFINTARAGLVDENALVKALQDHWIRSAGLDVFSEEPLGKDHPLMKLENVTLTPHRAGGTSDVVSNSIDIMIEQLEAYFQS